MCVFSQRVKDSGDLLCLIRLVEGSIKPANVMVLKIHRCSFDELNLAKIAEILPAHVAAIEISIWAHCCGYRRRFDDCKVNDARKFNNGNELDKEDAYRWPMPVNFEIEGWTETARCSWERDRRGMYSLRNKQRLHRLQGDESQYYAIHNAETREIEANSDHDEPELARYTLIAGSSSASSREGAALQVTDAR
ncbi:hypothetical protein BDQ12DRAFT_671108 [Crucibulum laeve]|uniref:Uncharacterized protein n=1 Tax=Crucibulum laeve TaxID=68775 RepID=A0A5C3LUH4_9AGAR|nr:hypothetical protein BDQ12DRAFT_671108 [Crucibulum laeve]